MLRYIKHTTKASRAVCRGQGQCFSRSHTSGGTDDPSWFQELRAELLARDLPTVREYITRQHQYKLEKTLEDFVPANSFRRFPAKNAIVPVGQHLIWFNPTAPAAKLLPDGTDTFHSPGDPWVRRMWSGGSVRVNKGKYFKNMGGFSINTEYVATVRIKNVQLRGENDAAKIFVTIERNFARLDDVYEAASKSRKPSEHGAGMGYGDVLKHFKSQPHDLERGTTLFTEERNLVFFKRRTSEELEAFKAGQLPPARYLSRPGEPDFSSTLTPTRSLLFRYSALTFNAHLIHLDKEYAQNVEGHRNLLIHGPLTLTLMLQAISQQLRADTKGTEVIESIEYRNLAPLYCDEEMRICGRKKKDLSVENGSVYDVWIEGPTGGVAVKGTVRTVQRSSLSTSDDDTPSQTLSDFLKESQKLPKSTAQKARKRSTFERIGVRKYQV